LNFGTEVRMRRIMPNESSYIRRLKQKLQFMYLQHQYEFVKSSRKVLLEYCKTLSDNDFLIENSTFGRGSVRNLLVHIGNTYEFWIGRESLKKNIKFAEYNSVKNVSEAEVFFSHIDSMLEEFLIVYAEKYMIDIEITIQGKTNVATPLKLFTHVITHEFHHKGQILSLSRHLGYVPVDTDIIR
jgi:uncharacterized damage-inducible protein DinB